MGVHPLAVCLSSPIRGIYIHSVAQLLLYHRLALSTLSYLLGYIERPGANKRRRGKHYVPYCLLYVRNWFAMSMSTMSTIFLCVYTQTIHSTLSYPLLLYGRVGCCSIASNVPNTAHCVPRPLQRHRCKQNTRKNGRPVRHGAINNSSNQPAKTKQV